MDTMKDIEYMLLNIIDEYEMNMDSSLCKKQSKDRC